MDFDSLVVLLGRYFTTNLSISRINDAVLLNLPFTDHDGDTLQIQVSMENGVLTLQDIGRSAGLLFSLGMQGAEHPAHLLLKNLAKRYSITMDYNLGVMRVSVPDVSPEETIIDFAKVLIAVNTTLPCFPVPKKEAKIGSRLTSRLANDIVQLRLKEFVQKQAEIEGKHERWTVSYRYPIIKMNERIDVNLLAVDLDNKEPRKTVEHIITLAYDVLAVKDHRELRVVYQVDQAMSPDASYRAGELLGGFEAIGYNAFNYALPDIRTNLQALTIQELTPIYTVK